MTVPFKELAGSPKETIGPDGLKAERRVVCLWVQRFELAAELLGDGAAFGTIGKAPYPLTNAVVAKRAAIEPLTGVPPDIQLDCFDEIAEQLNIYGSPKFALVRINYETHTFGDREDLPEIEDETFMTYRMTFGGEYMTKAGQSLEWEFANVPVPPEAVQTVRIPITEHHISWFRVINPPWTAIRETIGLVNAEEFLGSPPETVLFDGCTADKEFIRLDDLLEPEFGWRMDYVFREKAFKVIDIPGGGLAGWNDSYRSLPAGAPGWEKLVDPDGEHMYRTGDFAKLFEFAAVT